MTDNKKILKNEESDAFTSSPMFEQVSLRTGKYKIKHDWGTSKYTVAQIGQSYRVINHWCEAGLIDEERNKGKGWRKFNLYDVIWIKIIGHLRNLGVSIEALKIAKNTLMSDELELQRYITAVLTLGRKIEIIIYPDGRAFFASKKFKLKMELNGKLEDIYTSLNFNFLIKELFKERYNPPANEPYFLPVSKEREYKLFETILEGKYDEIQVIFKDGEVDRYITAKDIDIDGTNFNKELEEVDYGNLEIVKKEGKVAKIRKKVAHK